MNVLELFAGAGGGILGSRLLGHRTVCAVERDPYCREILLRRQEEGHLEPFPVWDDVRTFRGRQWRGVVDIVAAGFPCQPWSTVGKRGGEQDDGNLWPDTIRVAREVGPRYVFLENSPRLAAQPYFWDVIIPELAQGWCRVSWGVVRASDTGAHHRRPRLWILADTNGEPVREQQGRGGRADREDTEEYRRDPRWPGGSGLPRVAHGLAWRLDRARALGNGQVPRVAARAWRLLS